MTTEKSATVEVRRIVEDAGTSFYWAMRLLPAERRDAMFAVYAFCREVDDIADGELPVEEKRVGLDEWRAEIARIFEGEPESTVGRALAAATRDYGLDRADMEAIVDGMEMDATGEALAPDMQTLITYCNRVASAVGLLSIKVFGDDSEDARRGAVALGHALQLTNILRDVVDDAARGRLYLPRELLLEYGIAATNPAEVIDNQVVSAVCDELAEVAANRFAEARKSFKTCNRKALKPAFAMMDVYRLLLRRMQARGWTRLDKRVRIGPLAKLWIALKHML
ncbi:MAG: presqualene diphosphate synthase HpnD [Alphaproteobacteria bacterium]|nr:presqualene diphosphate synthase HpnD [Alphaproteobacteria bacterium]